MVVERASVEVFRLSLTGDKARGEEEARRGLGGIIPVISSLVRTFLIGGKAAGLCLAKGDPGSPPCIPSPSPCSDDVSPACEELAFWSFHTIMVPSRPVVTTEHSGLRSWVFWNPRRAMSLMPSV
jgi:hypothetical protein